jgi:hypothetical protein
MKWRDVLRYLQDNPDCLDWPAQVVSYEAGGRQVVPLQPVVAVDTVENFEIVTRNSYDNQHDPSAVVLLVDDNPYSDTGVISTTLAVKDGQVVYSLEKMTENGIVSVPATESEVADMAIADKHDAHFNAIRRLIAELGNHPEPADYAYAIASIRTVLALEESRRDHFKKLLQTGE